MLDILTAASGLAAVAGTGTGTAADDACAASAAPFQGYRMAAQVLGMATPQTGAELTAGLTQVPVLIALYGRGYILLNRAGRYGVSIGYGRVVEPAGRQYAMTVSDPDRWVAGWAPPTVRRTL